MFVRYTALCLHQNWAMHHSFVTSSGIQLSVRYSVQHHPQVSHINFTIISPTWQEIQFTQKTFYCFTENNSPTSRAICVSFNLTDCSSNNPSDKYCLLWTQKRREQTIITQAHNIWAECIDKRGGKVLQLRGVLEGVTLILFADINKILE